MLCQVAEKAEPLATLPNTTGRDRRKHFFVDLLARRLHHSLTRAREQSLEAMLDERQTPEEKGAVALRERGYGPTSALANLRLFDAPEGTGMNV